MTVSDLRAELGATTVPDFEMTLPPGWTRQAVDETTLDGMLGALRKRLMEAHKPQAYAELQPLVKQSFEAMRRQGAFAFFSPTEPDDSTVWLPASIIASERRAEAGQNLDDLARTLIREEGATPLAGDKRTLRFERERPVRVGSQTVISHSIIYLTPIPGTGRRRALQLVAGFGRVPEDASDDPFLMKTKYLFDSCVATLRWRAPQST
ncbi:protein TPRXL [Nocardioides piscis]|uniref:Protein TPRXL n=1 Tax=Nocardioides piscis TaxID=2714938 RepID=A0A6G7YIN5_9ACTN|nr:protein TPRXL [Nocardioides piscis]QIK76588.1 protein TPRXL [Nocardioides piscis]